MATKVNLPVKLQTYDGREWNLPIVTRKALRTMPPKSFVTRVIAANAGKRWEGFRLDALVEIFTYLLKLHATDAKSPPTTMAMERRKIKEYKTVLTPQILYQKLAKFDMLLPTLETFNNTMLNAVRPRGQDANSPGSGVVATISASIRALVPAGSLARTKFDQKLGSRNRTLLVSFSDMSFLFTRATSHVHVVLPSSPKVARFLWHDLEAPSVAITFKNTQERDTAMAILEATNLRGDLRHVDVAAYDEATHRNVIWSLACRATNLSRLHATLMAMLPHASYVPAYRLTEHEKKKGKGLVVKTVGSPSWLQKLIPQSKSGYEWRVSGIDQGGCQDCPKDDRPNEALNGFNKSLLSLRKRTTFNPVDRIRFFEVIDEEDEEGEEDEDGVEEEEEEEESAPGEDGQAKKTSRA
ncbi:MAG: hypothetical protein Q9208_001892 [Pyrenodesmia sp. 3 TL-2023]